MNDEQHPEFDDEDDLTAAAEDELLEEKEETEEEESTSSNPFERIQQQLSDMFGGANIHMMPNMEEMFGGGGGDQGEGGFMCASPKAHITQSRFTTDMCVGARVQG